MALSKIYYKANETIITANNLNNIQDEIIRLENETADLSGAIFNSALYMNATNKGYYLTDKTGFSYPGIYDNNSNFWIGATHGATTHHTGATYISSGFDSANNIGYPSIYTAVAKFGNSGSNKYLLWHDGYVNCDKIYPIGFCYTTSTKTNPSTIFPGTTWELIDKRFAYKTGGGTSGTAITNLFTADTTNVSTVNGVYFIREGHHVKVHLSVYIKVAVSGTNLTLGTFNLDTIGITGFPLTVVSMGAADGFNGIPVYQITGAGKVTHVDLINTGTSKKAVTATSAAYVIQTTLPVSYTSILDSACDQFIWKRTA